MSEAAELPRAARSSASASSSVMLAGGNSAAWSIRCSSTGGPLAALDPAARHDVVAAVRPAHPCLVTAVVVGCPQHERALLALDGAGLVALLVEPAPHPDEGVRLPLVADRRRVRVSRVHAR